MTVYFSFDDQNVPLVPAVADRSVQDDIDDFIDSANSLDTVIDEMRDIFTPKLLIHRFDPHVLIPRRVFPHSVAWDLYTRSDFKGIVGAGKSLLVPLG